MSCDQCGLDDPECNCWLSEVDKRVTELEKILKILQEHIQHIHQSRPADLDFANILLKKISEFENRMNYVELELDKLTDGVKEISDCIRNNIDRGNISR